MISALDLGNYYCVPPDLRDLNYSKYIDKGRSKADDSIEYNSDNTQRLNEKETIELLLKLETISKISKGDLSSTFEDQ